MSDRRFTALITGASSGIGWSYAIQLAQRSTHSLLLVARRLDRLDALKAKIESLWEEDNRAQRLSAHVFQADLTDQVQRTKLLSYIKNQELQIDILVNSAGFATLGEFANSDFSQETKMIELNCIAPIHLTRSLIESMQKRKHGTIINVSSIGAFQPAPYMATYAATKSFLLSFSLALCEEVKDKGIHILTHCPGPTNTEFHLVAGLPEKMSTIPAMSSEDSVREALKALDHGKHVIINGFMNKCLINLGRLVSLQQSAKVAKKMLEPLCFR